jgi:hypothetical protein
LANKREEREKHKEKARKRYEILKKRLKEQEEYLKKERLKRRIKRFFPGIISGIAIKLSSVKSDLKSFNKRRKRKKKIIRKPKVIREPIRYRLDRILNSERITERRKNILRGGTAALAALMLWGGANYAENHRVNSWKDSTTNVEINMDNTEKTHINFVLKAEQRYNTHEVRVGLETAKMLQKVGFDWECECAILPGSLMADKAYHYNHNGSHNYNNKEKYPFEIYSAPSLDVAQRWLREIHAISIDIKSTITGMFGFEAHFISEAVKQSKGFSSGWLALSSCVFNTYEEAQEAGIQKCLTILLEEKK